MTPPKSNKRFFTPSNSGFFIEIFCKVSASREKNRASREKNEACFDFSEAQPVLSKKQNQACLKFDFSEAQPVPHASSLRSYEWGYYEVSRLRRDGGVKKI